MFILQKGIVMASPKESPKKKPTAKATTKKETSVEELAPKKVAAQKKAAVKAVKETVSKESAAKPKKSSKNKAEPMSGFERYKMIEVAAYYLAEKSGFAGHAADYWVAAEKEIDKKGAKK
jgi:hypothetical protein